MAENTNTNSTQNQTTPPQRKQDIPVFSSLKLVIRRIIGLCFSSGGGLLLLTSLLFCYDYYNGERNVHRSLETYKTTLDNLSYMGTWFDTQAVFTHIVHSIQDGINYIIQKFTGNNTASFLTFKSDAYGYKSEIIDVYNKGITNGNKQFEGNWKNVSEFLYYYCKDTLLTILTLGLKLLMIVNFSPVYILATLPALVNGYTERKIATFKGELDKEDRVEMAYRKLRLVSITVLYFFVAIPHAINPLVFFVPSACLTAISVRFLVRYYKKYW